MARPPALQSGARLGLRGRAGDLDQRHRAAAAAGWTYGLAGGRWWGFTLRGGWAADPLGDVETAARGPARPSAWRNAVARVRLRSRPPRAARQARAAPRATRPPRQSLSRDRQSQQAAGGPWPA